MQRLISALGVIVLTALLAFQATSDEPMPPGPVTKSPYRELRSTLNEAYRLRLEEYKAGRSTPAKNVAPQKLHVQMGGQFFEQLFVGQVDAVVMRSEGQQSVQRTGVQQVPAQSPGQQIPAIVPLPEPLGPSMVMTGGDDLHD